LKPLYLIVLHPQLLMLLPFAKQKQLPRKKREQKYWFLTRWLLIYLKNNPIKVFLLSKFSNLLMEPPLHALTNIFVLYLRT